MGYTVPVSTIALKKREWQWCQSRWLWTCLGMRLYSSL